MSNTGFIEKTLGAIHKRKMKVSQVWERLWAGGLEATAAGASGPCALTWFWPLPHMRVSIGALHSQGRE